MQIKKCVAIILVYLSLLSGCSTTSLEGVKNPELSALTFNNLLIVVPLTDIGYRKIAEEAFVKQFKMSGIDSIASIELLPPIKDYEEIEILNILEKNEIDGVLVIALKDYWEQQIYVPKSSSTTGTANLYGNSLYYQGYTREYGDYHINKPRVKCEIRLFDRKSGKTAWVASSHTAGNAFAKTKTLSNSLTKEVVRTLIEENFIGE